MNSRLIQLFFIFLALPFTCSAMSNEEYINWWYSYRHNPSIPEELREMEDHFINSGLIVHSSKYWNFLNQQNIQQIAQFGYQNFKQTVTKNYFTWLVAPEHGYSKNLQFFAPKLVINIPPQELNRVHSLFTPDESYQYNYITMLFLNFFANLKMEGILEHLEEPLIGNPPYIMYKDKRVSQDVMNSLLEYLPISQCCPLHEISTIIEIGAGSGRTAFCFLKMLPNVKYVIVDLPPALFVSQQYLSDVFPEKRVMKFRPFDTFSEIADEYEQSDIIFLMPNQISKLPDSSSDLFLAVDCLHEMKPKEISFYFDEAERLSSYFYFKCWQKTKVPFDDYEYRTGGYPVKENWTKFFHEPCIVPSDFFQAFYLMKK